MEPISCAVLVLGGGPGGYVCAIRAGQLGLDTVLVESGRLGGANAGAQASREALGGSELLGCMDHGLGWNAADIEARAPEPTRLDEHGVEPELPGADGAHVATWSAAEH